MVYKFYYYIRFIENLKYFLKMIEVFSFPEPLIIDETYDANDSDFYNTKTESINYNFGINKILILGSLFTSVNY